MKVLESLNKLCEGGIVSLLELEYVRYLTEINPDECDEVLWAAAACLHAQRNGHVCLDFDAVRGDYVFNDHRSELKFTDALTKKWIEKLNDSDLVSNGRKLNPLVLEENRLYLHKFWKYEEELAAWLAEKSRVENDIDDTVTKAIHSVVKPKADLFEVNWQQVAIYLSFLKNLLVISGGPGTGKTYTVLSILASHVLVYENQKIALAAPTGKAARRLSESIEQGKQHLPNEAVENLDRIHDATSVHKLLGSDYSGTRFKFNEKQKLPYDLVVIDEASMLDINMWIRLIRAIGENTKLIVLGDKDQLASVEAGSILGDICQGENSFSTKISEEISKASGMQVPQTKNKPAINDCILFLKKSYRFGENSGIQQFAEAVNAFDDNTAIEVLKDPAYKDISWVTPNDTVIKKVIEDYAVSHYLEYSKLVKDVILSASNKRKILCSVRNGPMGMNRINQMAERRIRLQNGTVGSREWYAGRIIMATKNNHTLKIRNGEIGVCLGEEASRISFEGEDVREISTTRMNEYEPAYAITIHKSQGSEFDDVAILLSGSVKTILSKEILYTSVTRARKNTLVIGNEDTIREAIKHSVNRNSGLQLKIWGRN